jgi:arylsulfatase
MVRIPEGTAPDFKNKSYRITADVEIPQGGAEVVLMTQGGRFNGLGLYMLQGRPVFHYNLVGVEQTTLATKDALAPGKHTITLDFRYDGDGIGKGGLLALTVDGKEVANGKLARTIPFRVSADETLDIGEDTGTPVSEDYHVPFKFNGTLNKVVIDLGEAKLSPQEQKELDQQEGTNEVVD